MSPANIALWRACSLLLFFVAGSLQQEIEHFSVPKVVQMGNKAELQCQYELSAGESDVEYVKWWWKHEPPSGFVRKQIYQRIAGHAAQSIAHPNFSEIEIKDNDTIVLTKVTPVDSGTYECEVSGLKEKRRHDELIVINIGNGPILNITENIIIKNNTEEKSILIECQAEDVAPKPNLSVQVNTKDIEMTTTIEDDDDNGLYSVYAQTNYSTTDTNELQVSCKIFYQDIANLTYEDSKTFQLAGCDLQTTTEMPDDTTELQATPESLQNSRDDGVQLHSSWVLLAIVAILAHLNILISS